MELKKISVVIAIPLMLSACAGMTENQQAAAMGAGIGTLIGAGTTSAMSKGDGKSTRQGAVAGAAIGALGGYIWSSRMQAQKEKMQRETAGTGIAVSQTDDNRLKLEVPSDISFDTSRADIRPEFQSVLNSFAQSLRSHTATRVDIVGHTDSTGSDQVNNPLSVRRAASTRDYLASLGVTVGRIAIDGRGSSQPVADNSTRTGRGNEPARGNLRRRAGAGQSIRTHTVRSSDPNGPHPALSRVVTVGPGRRGVVTQPA